MPDPIIWYFIKFFAEESYADQFMAGSLYLNTLAYFKKVETESNDGRMDSTEAIAAWLQPDDITIKFDFPGCGNIVISKKDLAGPVSMTFDHHSYLHLYCLYAVHTSGFEIIDGKIDCAPEDIKNLQQLLKIDERCFNFGKFAIIIPALPFLNQLKESLKIQSYKAIGKLVEYYDDRKFHGIIPMPEIPFRKQERFSYQREWRMSVDTGNQTDSALTINIGDISDICAKVESSKLPELFGFRFEPAPANLSP